MPSFHVCPRRCCGTISSVASTGEWLPFPDLMSQSSPRGHSTAWPLQWGVIHVVAIPFLLIEWEDGRKWLGNGLATVSGGDNYSTYALCFGNPIPMSTWRESWFFFTMVGDRLRPVLAKERGGAAAGATGAGVTITGTSGGVSVFSMLWGGGGAEQRQLVQ